MIGNQTVQAFNRLKIQLKQFLWYFTKGLAIKATLYRGKLKDTDIYFRCLMIGPTFFPAEFRQKIYSDKPEIIRVVRIPFFVLAKYLTTHTDIYDLCVAVLPQERNWLLQKISKFTGQGLVTQDVSTAGGWEFVRKNMSRAKRSWLNNFRKNSHPPAVETS